MNSLQECNYCIVRAGTICVGNEKWVPVPDGERGTKENNNKKTNFLGNDVI
jgi:hypothetical protein